MSKSFRALTFILAAGVACAMTPEQFVTSVYFRWHPVEATSAGLHQFDTQLDDYSPNARRERLDTLRRYEREFAAQPSTVDRDLVLNRIRAELLELEQIRMWEKNPDVYSSAASGAAFTIMSRKFAPQPDRLRSLIAREKRMPVLLEQGKANLRNPPRIYTEVALEQIPGIVSFFEKDVPAAFTEVKDAALLAEFRTANASVVAALQNYGQWLKTVLLPQSKGDFRIGADLFRKKLLYEEMVDTPLPELLAMGYDDLRRNQREFARVAGLIDAQRTPEAVLAEAGKDHPAPGDLLQAFRNTLGGLQDFIRRHHIVTIPSPVQPILEESPPFMRALSSASMDTPGAFEKVAKEAFFNVTLPDPGWPQQKTGEWMEGFNRGVITSTAIHEAYPGHYTQFLWVQSAPSIVRKVLGAGSNAEGWAHYCEQMMLDEGYGNGDRKLRLGQLQDALLRNARYVVGIQMHTGKMTFDQAVDFFLKEGHQTRPVSQQEAKRGTSDPTYLMYTLGKLEIMRLREDYRKAKGAQFSLEEFHNRFLQQGYPPISIVRKELVGR